MSNTDLVLRSGDGPDVGSDDGRRRGDRRPNELFASGLRHYHLSEWAAALDDFKAAYRQQADPVFLFNIAQCYRQMGEPQQAQTEYRAYFA